MVDYENIRITVKKGLQIYLKCPVIRSNQNAEPPAYPYLSYTVTTLMSENKGTYGEYEDGKARKPVTTVISFTALSDDNIESVTLANKAREWLDYVGTGKLNDNDVIVQSVTGVSNRDNVLTAEYEYRNGFDAFFWGYDEVDIPDKGSIEGLEIGEDQNQRLENRLDGVERTLLYSANPPQEESEEALELLKERLDGVI